MSWAAAGPFEVLGVAPGASHAQVKAAFRRLARELHPDVGGDAAAFRALHAAYIAAIELSSRVPDPSPRVGRPVPPPPTAGFTRVERPMGSKWDHVGGPPWRSNEIPLRPRQVRVVAPPPPPRPVWPPVVFGVGLLLAFSGLVAAPLWVAGVGVGLAAVAFWRS